ncbi:hypothetical protein Nepgr_024375 [Nepenthes gracilis]|uniref:Uncharacterized protein n=1 Tax=Nepenthes gracilis TaxID=150966 RepID=A0AAD3T5V5_NEPGR|nr:hypothetical protein Nepgr_024375 [Nepenthes gracilis]
MEGYTRGEYHKEEKQSRVNGYFEKMMVRIRFSVRNLIRFPTWDAVVLTLGTPRSSPALRVAAQTGHAYLLLSLWLTRTVGGSDPVLPLSTQFVILIFKIGIDLADKVAYK